MATEMRITMPDATAAELRRVAAEYVTTPGEVIRRLIILREKVLAHDWGSVRQMATSACVGKMPLKYTDVEATDGTD